MLSLSPQQLEAVRAHGVETYPHECCGFILGHSANGTKSAAVLIRADNQRTDSARNRYLISPEDYLRAELEAERTGREILGFYHSHPDAEARPSEFDRQHALPGCSYIIVSVKQGRAESLTSWVLSEDYSVFESEEIV